MRKIQDLSGLIEDTVQALNQPGHPQTEIFGDEAPYDPTAQKQPERSPQTKAKAEPSPNVLLEKKALQILAPLLTAPWTLIGMSVPLIFVNARLIGTGNPEIWIIYTVGIGAIGLMGLVSSLQFVSARMFALSIQFLLVATGCPAFVFCLLMLAKRG